MFSLPGTPHRRAGGPLQPKGAPPPAHHSTLPKKLTKVVTTAEPIYWSKLLHGTCLGDVPGYPRRFRAGNPGGHRTLGLKLGSSCTKNSNLVKKKQSYLYNKYRYLCVCSSSICCVVEVSIFSEANAGRIAKQLGKNFPIVLKLWISNKMFI